MQEKVLRIQMFGSFSMYYGNEAVTLNKIGSSKSVRLLQMLLLSLQSGIAKNELIDHLYGWNENNDTANRNKNLNNLIYRLKGQLIACGLPDNEYVVIRDGMCYFKSSIPLELDTQEFEEEIERSNTGGDISRVQLLLKAIDIYCGELLPANQSDMWFYQRSGHFKRLYVRTILELEDKFIKNHDYKNRLLIYSRAAAIYPFDNWQTRLINCNLEIYRYDEAMKIYLDTMDLYAREMGSPPTAELQKCFDELKLMDENHRRNPADINSWRKMDKAFMGRKNEIKRAIFEEDSVEGAYYCTYPSFVDYCRIVARAKKRNEFRAMLMFLTLSHKGKKEQKQIILSEQMDVLKQVIGNSLRIGDAYTRYGNRHFILMLVEADENSCSRIFQRIEKTYSSKAGKAELWYYADMTQELNTSL